MSETTTNDAKLADLLLATIHSELALGFDFLKLDVGAMETEALAEHVAKRVRALLAAETPQPTDAAALLEVARRMAQAHRWAEAFDKACEAAEAALLAAGTPQPTATAYASGIEAAALLCDEIVADNREASERYPNAYGTHQDMAFGAELCAENIRRLLSDPFRAVVPPPPDTAAAPTTERDGLVVACLATLVNRARGGGMVQLYRDVNGCYAARLVRADTSAVEFGRWSTLREAVAAGVGQDHVAAVRAPAPATDDAPTDAMLAYLDREISVCERFRDDTTMDRTLRHINQGAARALTKVRDRLLRGASPRGTAPAPTTEASDA